MQNLERRLHAENCTAKPFECCIECADLEACEKDLWKRFPKFKEQVVGLRKRYLAQS